MKTNIFAPLVVLVAIAGTSLLERAHGVTEPSAFSAQAPSPGAPHQAPAASAQTGTPAIKVEEDVIYATVNGTELHLDVYEPAEQGSALRSAIILIHGGGWSDFDKSTMRGMGHFLAGHGFVAFSVDYRLFHGKDNLWPAQLDDVQRAVRWVRANASKYGVDPEKMGAFGHSAGAQLAALLGMEDTRDNSDPALAKYSSKVQAVVDVSGPANLTKDHDAESIAFMTAFLGTDYEKHPEVWREASPAFCVSKDDAAFLIVHGTQDQNVPIEQSQELFEKLQAAGVQVSFIKVNDVHTFQTAAAKRELVLETLAFFNRNLTAVP
jgi:acetyl esterase/lipase